MQKSLIYLTVILIAILACSKKTNDGEATVATDSTAISNNENTEVVNSGGVFLYEGAEKNEISATLQNFIAFEKLHELASKSIEIKDSLERLRETVTLSNPKDSAIFMPYQKIAFEAILDYQKWMQNGPTINYNVPDLLQLSRNLSSADSANDLLTSIMASNFLSSGKFFFVGGAPFISKINSENNEIFRDANGNPETRYESSNTENGNFVLNSLYKNKNVPTNISFGPPLDSYDSGPQEVNGIGSLIHDFVSRIPVFFITNKGAIPAQFINIKLKIVPEQLGCRSDNPRMEFACNQNIEEKDILAVYIPYETQNIDKCTITSLENGVWTADLNADGVADIAYVPNTFAGASSDTMSEALWFVNVNGKWQIIDWARELDCT